MEILVREVQDEDFPFIFDLASKSVQYQISPLRENINLDRARENYLRDLEIVRLNIFNRPNSHFLIATSGCEKLGYLLMATDVTESTTGIEQGWIFDIVICESYWDSEVPHKLLDCAEDIARKKSLKHFALQLTCSHEKALNFFKSRGYEEERKRMFKKLPFEYRDEDKERREMLKALEGIKFKIKLPKM